MRETHRDSELIGPYGPDPDMNPALFESMDCARCHQPITLDHQWFMEVPPAPPAVVEDGPVYHGDCLVG